MTHKQKIADYLSQATRNRLVFCYEHIDDLSFINIGREMAEALAHENLRSPMIAYTAEDILAEILSTPQNDPTIGSYVAIENIGILFEPELAFNLKSIFDSVSTKNTLIVCSEGLIRNNRFFFLQEGDGVSIDLQGLSFIEI